MTIRQAAATDIAGIRRLMQSVPGFWQPVWRDDVLERGLRSADGLAFVGEVDGKLAGFVCAHDVGFRAYLSELVVAEAHRGTGMGRSLVECVEQAAIARGCPVLFSDVWRDAEGFYRALGWSSPDVVLLRKKLM
jgi:GNAT superfamily N-acetyltransferase